MSQTLPVSVASFILRGISSMATRQVLADLALAFEQQSGHTVLIESVGGVDAAKRVQAGEAFDVVILASDAIERLVTSGHIHPGSRVDLMRSGVAVAVRAGAPLPDIGTEEALRRTVCAAQSISYSTGPSGAALIGIFERWGLADDIQSRMVLAPPGVPVASLVAGGKVELGFQQLSELLNVPGVVVVGPLPPAVQFMTTFSAGLAASLAPDSPQAGAASALLEFMASPQADAAKLRQGMAPA
jgi:molybdate transport system substrate-binding protein